MGKRGVHVPQKIPGDPTDRHGFPALIEEFLTDLGSRGYSEATIRNRRQRLATLAGWLKDRGVTRPVQVTRPILVRYQRHLFHYRKADGEPLSFRSQNEALLPIRAFFKWAVRNDHVGSNPASELELPKVEKRLPKAALSVEEAEAVLAVPDLSRATGVRDRAMIEVLYGTGIRRGELARLNVRDLDVERHTLMVRQGKGRKDRMVPIGPRAVAWIERYLVDVRPGFAVEPDDGTLFLTVDGTPFSVDRLTQLVRDYVKASGTDKEGACHLFRHTLATLMLEGGADIRYIQAMLGHAELSTTQIYTQVSIRALQAVHAATFPGASNSPRSARPERSDPDVSDGSFKRVSAAELLAAVDSEIDLENRGPAGSTGDPTTDPRGVVVRALEEASSAAESVRALNHQTMAGAVLDVAEIYSLLAELSLLAGRLPQLLRQLEHLVNDLVEAGEVRIVDGPNAGDPAAAGAIAGHWLAAASGAADELARRVDQAQQALTWAAPTQP